MMSQPVVSLDAAHLSSPFHTLHTVTGTPSLHSHSNVEHISHSVWMNAPAPSVASDSSLNALHPLAPRSSVATDSLSANTVKPLHSLPHNSFAQSPPSMVAMHYTLVRHLSSQVDQVKHTLRSLLASLQAYASESASENPEAGGASPSAMAPSKLHLLSSLSEQSEKLKSLQSQLKQSLITSAPSDELVFPSGVKLLGGRRALFDLLDSRYLMPSGDMAATTTIENRHSDSKFHVAPELISGDPAPVPDSSTGKPLPATLNLNLASRVMQQTTLAFTTPTVESHTFDTSLSTLRISHRGDHSEEKTQSLPPHSAFPAVTPQSALSSIKSRLNSSKQVFDLHAGLLLNLVQSSALNPFEEIQQLIRNAAATEPTQKIRQQSTGGNLPVSAPAYVASVDRVLKAFLHAHLVQNQSADHMPVVRKIFHSKALNSPFFTPAPVVAGSISQTGPVHPIAAVILSVPNVLHAYVEVGSDPLSDVCEAEGRTQSDMVDPFAGAISQDSLDAPPLRVLGVSVVHWSELSILADAHAQSAFHSFRHITAQAKQQLHNIKQFSREHAAEATNETVLQRFLAWMMNYRDLYSQPCVCCKQHLCFTGASPLAVVCKESTSDYTSAPLVPDASVLMLPTVRLSVSDQQQSYQKSSSANLVVALHAACVDRFLWNRSNLR